MPSFTIKAAGAKSALEAQGIALQPPYGNALPESSVMNISSVVVAPSISTLVDVKTVTDDRTPSYSFKSSITGRIIYSGLCSSTNKVAVAGKNTINFSELPLGVYSNCNIQVKDAGGINQTFCPSNLLLLKMLLLYNLRMRLKLPVF